MSKDLEERVDRLEKIAGASGYDIHEFDSPAQAEAHAKQLEAEAKAGEKAEAAAAKTAGEGA